MSTILNIRATLRGYNLPIDFKAALETILVKRVNEPLSRTRLSTKRLSIKTQEYRVQTLCRSFEELRANGYALQYPRSLKSKHLQFLVTHWVSQGESGGTIENKLTYFRALATWLDKPNLVGTLADYVDRDEHKLNRSYVALEDKSWEHKGIDVHAKISEIAASEPYVAMQLELQVTFGLRVEESFLFRPLESMRHPEWIDVSRGTKGGRPRRVAINRADELNVLERALRLAEKTDVGSTIPDGYNLRQWKDHYYHVMKKHGVTRRALGITSHGLRHQNLQGLYARETGFEAPIKRPESRADLVAHRQALQIVVEAAGHSRPAKANAYLSTFHAQKKLSAPKISASDAREALEQTQGNKTHAAKALGISRQALYRLLEE